MYFTIANPQNGPDLWVQPLVDARPDPAVKPFPFLSTNFGEVWGQFSPDGRWILYQSNESGRWNVYVRPFPGPGGRWSVSSDGGVYPRWGPGGREVYYVAPDGTLMATPITVKGTMVEVGTAVRLFRPQILGGGVNLVGRGHQYDVAPDGRFLVNVETEASVISPITIILNWNEGR
jgi:hypothetical protein